MSDNSSPETAQPTPNVTDGIKYWETQPANYDGVLGGFGNGSLPRVDSLGSRQFLLRLLPELSTVPSAVRPLNAPPATDKNRRTRALDIGAGVGRVTSDVLLHLVSDVVLVEPVESFVAEAYARGRASATATFNSAGAGVPAESRALWKGLADSSKSVTFVRDTLQGFDPTRAPEPSKVKGRVGYVPPAGEKEEGYDVVWCQWCLGHLNDADLVAFLRKCKTALRNSKRSIVIVKENLCAGEEATTIFDTDDSTLTRSDLAWKEAFAGAGLTLIDQKVQHGFPAGLFTVKMYALR